MEEQKISLKQNRFAIFSIFYSQIAVIGAIVIYYVGKFLPNLLSEIAYICVFVFALYRAITAMKSNDRTLIASNTTLMLQEKVKKQNVLQFKIDDSEVEKVEQIEEDLFSITKKDGNIELIPLSFSLKATRELDLKVRAMLCQKYGERAEAISNEDVEEYIKTGVVSKEIEKTSKGVNSSNVAYSVIGLIFSAIPTLLAILAFLSLILKVVIFVLSLITGSN